MQSTHLLSIVFISSLFCSTPVFCATPGWSQESKTSKDSKPKGTLTLLGTIKGEVDKVSDGGRKIEVKFKEMVSTTTRSGSYTNPASSSARYRPPVPKEFTLKEKNREIELRLLDNVIIRLLDASEKAPSKGSDKKKGDKAGDKKDDQSDMDDDEKMTKKQSEKTADDSKGKATKNTPKKSTEPPLPGKPGDPGSLIKGQIIIVTVYREDLPGYSRLVASTIYILGEK